MASLNARINELVEHTAKVRVVSEWDADEALVTTVVLNVGDNVAVNFALFKELADIFKSEAISVRHSSGERVYSEYTVERWDDTEFTIKNVPDDVLERLDLT